MFLTCSRVSISTALDLMFEGNTVLLLQLLLLLLEVSIIAGSSSGSSTIWDPLFGGCYRSTIWQRDSLTINPQTQPRLLCFTKPTFPSHPHPNVPLNVIIIIIKRRYHLDLLCFFIVYLALFSNSSGGQPAAYDKGTLPYPSSSNYFSSPPLSQKAVLILLLEYCTESLSFSHLILSFSHNLPHPQRPKAAKVF